MGSTVITIPDGDRVASKDKTETRFSFPILVTSFVKELQKKYDMRKFVHSFKVGLALVLVSLLYLLDPLYKDFGDNAMWAIMTVVVTFEFFAGATLSKGLNRGIGTILGVGLGCLAAALAQEVGGVGNGIIVVISVFIFGAAATYSRLIPSVKKRYDYGVMIFILTFNLVVVSGIRAEKVLQLARERLCNVFIGFSVCIFTSLLLFPIWAGDELHNSLVSRFNDLAVSIEGCLEEYFRIIEEKETEPTFSFSSCKTILQSKSRDESLVNFAKWEPWHGRFGFFHPWEKYLKIGELLRDLSATILSLKPCLRSPRKESFKSPRNSLKEPCKLIGSSLAQILRSTGESIKKLRKCPSTDIITSELKALRQDMNQITSKMGHVETNCDVIATLSFLFALMEMVDKIEELAKEIDELGNLAGFRDI